MEQRMLLIFKYISNLTFRMLQHTSSEVTGHRIKWDHFQILASSCSDLHCKVKET